MGYGDHEAGRYSALPNGLNKKNMVQDILLDEDADLEIDNGDFKVGPSDEQHLMLIVNLAEGSIKQFPLMGVGINYYSGSTGQAANLRRNITVKAEADGYRNVNTILNQDSAGVFEYSIDAIRP